MRRHRWCHEDRLALKKGGNGCALAHEPAASRMPVEWLRWSEGAVGVLFASRVRRSRPDVAGRG